ncbi:MULTISPECIES: TorF family putative porin [Alkalimonas]|uniref:TorF family putative porin n=2 Tax=Alkalimonas TaxID=265980 RepID=A0ABU7J4P8_9GAMM|nr:MULTISPECIES: TorF family putative porin [unclassified Alkalimonas]MEE2001352.1 TorF family putative porin [Alkalimonas sp. MEB108]MEE2025609.1 TorF family putative porin [Alkalimonas sp. MEB004]
MKKMTGLMTLSAMMALQGWCGGPVWASTTPAFELAGEAVLISDYRFRGVSQTERSPAVQLEYSASHTSGFYATVWGSNISFGDGSVELDTLLGWQGDFAESFGLDVGVMRYWYPNADRTQGYNYNEWYAHFSWQQLELGMHYSPDYFGQDVGRFSYWFGRYSYSLQSYDVFISLGYNRFDSSTDLNQLLGAFDGRKSAYWDYQLGVSWNFADDWAFSLAWVGTSIGRSQCLEDCQSRAVFSLNRSF